MGRFSPQVGVQDRSGEILGNAIASAFANLAQSRRMKKADRMAEEDRQRAQEGQDLSLAMQGLHRGSAPTEAVTPVGGGFQMGADGRFNFGQIAPVERAPSRYTQLTPGFYRDDQQVAQETARTSKAQFQQALGKALAEAQGKAMGTPAEYKPVTTAEGVYNYDPRSGALGTRLGSRPESAPHMSTVTTDAGVFAFDPTKGTLGTRLGNRPPSAASEPNWTTVQTDGGIVQVNPKTGETRPVSGPGGQALRPKAPAQIAQAVSGNRRQIQVIDDAIRLLDEHPDAVGLKYNVVPDALAQVMQPEGVETRAAVSDIGSLLIHDRTGAAMNAAESVRLKPLIPGPGDQPEAAKTKLTRLRKLLQEDTDFLSQTYGLDAASPAAPAPAPAAAAPSAAARTAKNPWRP